MAKSSKKSKRKIMEEERREAILLAAAHLFVDQGFGGTTMQNIADAAGFSVGYIYKHFPGKNELLDEIIFSQLDRVDQERRETMADWGHDPLNAIRLDLIRSCEQIAEAGYLVSLFIEYEKANLGQIRPRLDNLRNQMEELFTQAMEKGQLKTVDKALLTAATDGVVWGLVKAMSDNNSLHRIKEIPALVEDLILKPLLIKENN